MKAWYYYCIWAEWMLGRTWAQAIEAVKKEVKND